MENFILAHASEQRWEAAVSECLRQLGVVSEGFNLGFLYVTDHFAERLGDILGALRQASGIADWTGTVGVGICCTDSEYMDVPSMAVLLARLPEGSFRIFPTLSRDAGEIETVLQDWATTSQPPFAIVHGDPDNPQTPVLITQLSAQLGGAFLVGGLTSSRGRNAQVAGQVTEGGLSGVLFTDEVPLATALTQGCTPIGDMHRISACRKNILISIDDEPALDVFRRDIGEILARDLDRVAGYVFAARPVPGSDTGDYTVRNIVGIDPANGLLAVGDIFAPGDPVMFCKRDAQSARDDMSRMLGDIKRRLDGRQPAGAVYYSCLGRGAQMFGSDSVELKMISAELGRIPLAGFYANGEISLDRLYGYTGVLTVFL